jgi:hypothetical protein
MMSVGSSAVERCYAKAEARVQFPAGAFLDAVVTQWQSASLPNWECGFNSRPLLASIKRPLPGGC